MGNWLAEKLPTILQEGEWQQIRLRPERSAADNLFLALSREYPELHLEQTAEGEIEIMAPTGGESGYRNSELNYQVQDWSKEDHSGRVFDSSTGFVLPNGAKRSPDVSWVRRERLAALTAEQKQKFLPLCPDFVVELRSSTDSLTDLEAKMEEYITNGARLGWLIDPDNRRVRVYRPGREPETLDNPATLSGTPELPGFTLDLQEIWEPDI
jgi:Uma2 family endonuclease